MDLDASADIVLNVDGISKFYFKKWSNRVVAVDDVSFQLLRGETLGLVGESGCGKSTLSKAILRLIEPTKGRILFEGEDLVRASSRRLRDLRKKMQMIFQDPFSSLNPRMTVEAILAEPFLIHGESKGSELGVKIKSLLELVQLPEKARAKYPHEFSGGQRQRIGIARALALNPTLIVADEPVSALDVSIQAQILNLLVDLKKQFRLSMIFVSHDLAVVEYLSDSIAVMYKGRIVESTSTAGLFKSAKHPYSRALLSAIPTLDSEIAYRVNDEKVRIAQWANENSCSYAQRCQFATEQCRTVAPLMRDVSSDSTNSHLVACHYA